MGEINRQGGSYDNDEFLVLVGVSRPLYDIIFYFQTVFYILTTSFSHVGLDVIYYMVFVLNTLFCCLWDSGNGLSCMKYYSQPCLKKIVRQVTLNR